MKKFKLSKKNIFIGGIVAGIGIAAAGLYFGKKFIGTPTETIFEVKGDPENNVVNIIAYDRNRFSKVKYATSGVFTPDGSLDFANTIMDVTRDVTNAVAKITTEE